MVTFTSQNVLSFLHVDLYIHRFWLADTIVQNYWLGRVNLSLWYVIDCGDLLLIHLFGNCKVF